MKAEEKFGKNFCFCTLSRKHKVDKGAAVFISNQSLFLILIQGDISWAAHSPCVFFMRIFQNSGFKTSVHKPYSTGNSLNSSGHVGWCKGLQNWLHQCLCLENCSFKIFCWKLHDYMNYLKLLNCILLLAKNIILFISNTFSFIRHKKKAVSVLHFI